MLQHDTTLDRRIQSGREKRGQNLRVHVGGACEGAVKRNQNLTSDAI